MRAEDIALIARTMTPVVREFVAQQQQGLLTELAELRQRLLAFEQRVVVQPKDGKDGKDADPAQVASLVSGQVQTAMQAVRDEAVRLITNGVEQAVAALPKPKDGQDGKDVSADDVEAMVMLHVERAVKALPVPQDGRSVTIDDVTPVIASEVSKAVERLPAPQHGKDGVGLTSALIDRDGHLVFMLSDGTSKDVGHVVGKDGRDGLDAVLPDIARLVQAEFAKIPIPKDGRDGIDFTVADLVDITSDGERTLTFQFRRDGVEKAFTVELKGLPVYRDVFKDGQRYRAGDIVTLGGSAFIAKADTHAKPGLNTPESRAWQLYVKRGRDGRDGSVGPMGPPGMKGDRGEPGGWK